MTQSVEDHKYRTHLNHETMNWSPREPLPEGAQPSTKSKPAFIVSSLALSPSTPNSTHFPSSSGIVELGKKKKKTKPYYANLEAFQAKSLMLGLTINITQKFFSYLKQRFVV